VTEHRRYLEHLILRDPRGQADAIAALRRNYRRDGASALPPTLPTQVVESETVAQTDAAPVDSLKEELDTLAGVIAKEDTDVTNRLAEVTQLKEGAAPDDVNRLERFTTYLQHRKVLNEMMHERPFWRPMIEALTEIWLADVTQRDKLRAALMQRRLALLSTEGISKLSLVLRKRAPQLVQLENDLIDGLQTVRPARFEAPRRSAHESAAPLPNLDSRGSRSWRSNDSGGFRWYHFVIGYFVLKFLYLIIQGIAGG